MEKDYIPSLKAGLCEGLSKKTKISQFECRTTTTRREGQLYYLFLLKHFLKAISFFSFKKLF